MEILNEKIKAFIHKAIIDKADDKNHNHSPSLQKAIQMLHAAIPDDKRISYGIVHTVKVLGDYLYQHITPRKIPLFKFAAAIFNQAENMEAKTVSLCMLSFHGIEKPESVFPYFEIAAADEDWEVREITQMLFRKIIKKHPEKAEVFLTTLVQSEDSHVRRFVGETLRPVCENKWFIKQPDYSLSILKPLFTEAKPYPRTSMGNNLSDLSRHIPERVYQLVEELVKSGNKHSYWIAYRACRNLVKKEPARVLKLLGTDTYKYKDRVHSVQE